MGSQDDCSTEFASKEHCKEEAGLEIASGYLRVGVICAAELRQ